MHRGPLHPAGLIRAPARRSSRPDRRSCHLVIADDGLHQGTDDVPPQRQRCDEKPELVRPEHPCAAVKLGPDAAHIVRSPAGGQYATAAGSLMGLASGVGIQRTNAVDGGRQRHEHVAEPRELRRVEPGCVHGGDSWANPRNRASIARSSFDHRPGRRMRCQRAALSRCRPVSSPSCQSAVSTPVVIHACRCGTARRTPATTHTAKTPLRLLSTCMDLPG